MYNIRDVVKIRTISANDEENETLDKKISDYTLASIDDRSLQVNIAFSKPSDITRNPTLDPDELEVKFLLP